MTDLLSRNGRRITFDGMVLYRMEEGPIAETRLHVNELMLLRQIGTTAASAPPAAQ